MTSAATKAPRAYGKRHTNFARWFPTPKLLAREGAGVDISDSSIKWVELAPASHGWEVKCYGAVLLEPGIVVEGVVRDVAKLAEALSKLRAGIGGSKAIHASLPEEAGYVFSMSVPDGNDRTQVLRVIEFELEGRVPLKATQAVFDYDIVGTAERGIEIGVTVFPASLVAGYIDAFARAGLELQSLEVEARSIARAAVAPHGKEVCLLADFGRSRTGFAIIKRGVPIFTSTVAVGGSALTETVMNALGVDEAAANEFKDNTGLSPTDNAKVHDAVVNTAAMLSDEILRHYRYWDTRRNDRGEKVTPVARVLLAGGSATLKGLPEFIASRVQAPTELVDVWRNVCSFDAYIPPIDQKQSLGYATAIGLALRGA